MNAIEFKKLSTKYLAPKLRDKGWKGSGFNFYRTTENNIVQIFGIQGAWYGGSVCCETAVHFDFLPDLAGNSELSKISFASCLIRERLSPKGKGDYHWHFSGDEKENIKSLELIFESLEKHGSVFYKDFENFPHPFDKIKPSDFKDGARAVVLNKYYIYNEFNFLWLLKEINLKTNKPETAGEFSKIGINKATLFFQNLIGQTKSKKQKQLAQQALDNLIKLLKIL